MFLVLNNDNVIMKITEQANYAHVIGEGDESRWEICEESIARNDYENRTITDNKIVDGGILLQLEKMIIPFISGANTIIEADIPEGVIENEYKYINGEFVINAPVRVENIKRELEELDSVINRATEDLYKATEKVPYISVLSVIERKDTLRTELAELENN